MNTNPKEAATQAQGRFAFQPRGGLLAPIADALRLVSLQLDWTLRPAETLGRRRIRGLSPTYRRTS